MHWIWENVGPASLGGLFNDLSKLYGGLYSRCCCCSCTYFKWMCTGLDHPVGGGTWTHFLSYPTSYNVGFRDTNIITNHVQTNTVHFTGMTQQTKRGKCPVLGYEALHLVPCNNYPFSLRGILIFSCSVITDTKAECTTMIAPSALCNVYHLSSHASDCSHLSGKRVSSVLSLSEHRAFQSSHLMQCFSFLVLL